jgi:hypothetical protein
MWVILKWILDKMVLYGLVQDRDQWRALVNTVIEPLGSINCWEVLE